MAKVIGVMGESGSGKTTAMRNLPPEETVYIDCDKKGLNWKGWKKQYHDTKDENNAINYLRSDIFANVSSFLDYINSDKRYAGIRYVVIDTINGLMVAEEMKILAMQSGDKRSAWSDLAHGTGKMFAGLIARGTTLIWRILIGAGLLKKSTG